MFSPTLFLAALYICFCVKFCTVCKTIIIKAKLLYFESCLLYFHYSKGYLGKSANGKYIMLLVAHQWCNDGYPSNVKWMVFWCSSEFTELCFCNQTWNEMKLIRRDMLPVVQPLGCLMHFTLKTLILFLIIRTTSPKGLVNPLRWFDLPQDITLMCRRDLILLLDTGGLTQARLSANRNQAPWRSLSCGPIGTLTD